MAIALSNAQLEILKMFSRDQPEEDLKELKSLLVTYLSDKVTREADRAFDKMDHTSNIFQRWKEDHFRRKG